jgi:Dolichyl-phosphate-mannose-protein mannosyltransferase
MAAVLQLPALRKKEDRFLSSEAIIILSLMLAAVLVQFLHIEYGYHRDELFYIAIGDCWSFSNLDMLPLSPLYLRFFTFLFGYSIKVVHLASSLCSACTLGIACLITREFGGKKYAILLTGIFMLFIGILAAEKVFTYNILNDLFWVAALYGFVKSLKDENPRWALFTGVVTGLGMLNKVTILFLPLAIVISLLFFPQRSWFRTKWLWIAACIIIIFSIPFLYWQFNRNWYLLTYAVKYSGELSYKASFGSFLWNQIAPNNILSFPIWMTGLLLLLFSAAWKTYRPLGITYIFLYLSFYLLHLPNYFLQPLYAVLIPVGAITIERLIGKADKGKSKVKIAQILIPLVYVFLSIPSLPFAFPVLKVCQIVKYASAFGVDAGVRTTSAAQNVLPVYYADCFGWQEMVKKISVVYHKSCVNGENTIGIFTGNYGEASAVHFYKSEYDLPEAISMTGWYYYNTLNMHTFKSTYLAIGVSIDILTEMFAKVEKKDLFSNPYCMPFENNQPIYLCSYPKYDLKKQWISKDLRH